jgi:Spy/CpxP family protein refolding chaperone
MKRTSATGLVLAGLLACSAAHAEPDEQKQARQLQKLQTELKLSEQQKQAVGKIFDETKPQLEALRKQRQELRDKMRERLKAVLTAEQMEKFDKLHQEHKAQKQQKRSGQQDD